MAIQTKMTEYKQGEEGYSAMVKDITSLFDWDSTEENEGNTNTSFKKNCGDGNGYVGLRIEKGSNYPGVSLICGNGSANYSTNINSSSSSGSSSRYVAYAYNANVLAFCGAQGQLPWTQYNYTFFSGISTSKNIKTNKTGYCCFGGDYVGHHFYSEENYAAEYVSITVRSNCTIAAAIPLHNPSAAVISNDALLLTALPDTKYGCLEDVTFNGTRYTRLGMILVPA